MKVRIWTLLTTRPGEFGDSNQTAVHVFSTPGECSDAMWEYVKEQLPHKIDIDAAKSLYGGDAHKAWTYMGGDPDLMRQSSHTVEILPPLVLVTVTGGVAEVQLEQHGSALVALYDFDGNDVSGPDEQIVLPEVAGKPDWAAIRADQEFHA